MASTCADTSEPLIPAATGCRGTYRIPGVFSGSRRIPRRPVAYAHRIEHRGHESEHPVHLVFCAGTRLPEIADGFPPHMLFRVVNAAAQGRWGAVGAKTLQRCPGLDEGAVHGEMHLRQQSGGGRLFLPAPEKGRGQVPTEKGLLILEKCGNRFQVIGGLVLIARSKLGTFTYGA